MRTIWTNVYFGNTVQDWVTAAAILVVSLLAIYIFKGVVMSRLKRWAERTTTGFDDFVLTLVEQLVVPLAYLAAVYFSLNMLEISKTVNKLIHVAYLFAITFFVIRIVTAIVKQGLRTFIRRRTESDAKEKEAKGIIIIVNVTIWILGIVFLIDNLGYDVTTIVAGLGIGGIAIALAAQTILGDLFSYFVIFFDRPFEIGDFIVVDDKAGVVEYIGIKTTRVKTLGGEQLICSNTFLTNARVHNYKRMEERRIVFKIGVIYQTPQQQLRRIPEMVKDIISSRENVRFDRGHFSAFGDFSLDFEFVYYVLNPDYNIYMDTQQAIYFNIAAAFERDGIEFAYPTQQLFVTRQQPEAEGTDLQS